MAIIFAVISGGVFRFTGANAKSEGYTSGSPVATATTRTSAATTSSTPVEVTTSSPTAGSVAETQQETAIAPSMLDSLEILRPDGTQVLLAQNGGVSNAAPGIGVDPPEYGKTVVGQNADSVLPAFPSLGTTLVYGHACLHHTCPFSLLYLTVQVGDLVKLTLLNGSVIFERIRSIKSVPKDGMGQYSFSDADLGIITCTRPGEGDEANNRVVEAVVDPVLTEEALPGHKGSGLRPE